MKRTEYISGLRAVADFFEQNPEVEAEDYPHTFNFPGRTKEDLAVAAKALGHAEKQVTDSHFVIHGVIGGHILDFYNNRDAICERIKVGEKVIPAVTLPARAEAVIIPARIEEVYEWKCPDSLLAAAR